MMVGPNDPGRIEDSIKKQQNKTTNTKAGNNSTNPQVKKQNAKKDIVLNGTTLKSNFKKAETALNNFVKEDSNASIIDSNGKPKPGVPEMVYKPVVAKFKELSSAYYNAKKAYDAYTKYHGDNIPDVNPDSQAEGGDGGAQGADAGQEHQVDDSGDTSGSTTTNTEPPPEPLKTRYINKAFTEEYMDSTLSNKSYYESLKKGLKVSSLRGILGMPPQYLPLTDPKLTPDDKTTDKSLDLFGRTYSDRIIKNMPLLLLTPGVPAFMSSFSKKDKLAVVKNFLGGSNKDFKTLFGKGSGKLYSLKYDYVKYFGYANTMLRTAALCLGIDGLKIDGEKLGNANWLYHTGNIGNANIFTHGNLRSFLGNNTGCVAFYADCGSTVSETFGNSTTQTSLSQQLNGLSDTGKELNFLAGNVSGMVGKKLDKWTGQEELNDNIESINKMIDNIGLGKHNLFSNIINKAQTLLAGGKLVFPEIWGDSSFGRSYQCNMKLIAPYGDRLSVYLYILVPIYHLLSFVLPRQSIGQAYFSPFLVRGVCQGRFNIDMGIITDLSVTKGAEGEWTADGIPTVAEVSFTIKDLYEGLFMSNDTLLEGKLFTNITELDYIANSCGVNINDQEISRLCKLWLNLTKSKIRDIPSNIFGSATQYVNNRLQSIFGVFDY